MQQKQNKIGEILNALDGAERAEPRPFFFTRLEARMAAKDSSWEKIITVITKPVIAYATVLLVLILNAYVIFEVKNDNKSQTSQNEMATIDEYTQMNTAFFDVEKLNP